MKRWSYKVVEFDPEGFWFGGNINSQSIEERLNELGNQGWEVAGNFATSETNGRTKKIVYTLKREEI